MSKFWYKKLHRNVWNTRILNYSELLKFLLKDAKAQNFETSLHKSEVPSFFFHNVVESLNDHILINQDVSNAKPEKDLWICSSWVPDEALNCNVQSSRPSFVTRHESN